MFLCVSSWSIKPLQRSGIAATVFQRGESEEPGPGARVVMEKLYCLSTIMMSDGWFTGSKWVLLQKCIPNFVASDWINRYKWAAVVYSTQGARHWYSARVCSLSARLPTDFKISFSIKGILHTGGQRWLLPSCCLPAKFVSFCLSFSISCLSSEPELFWFFILLSQTSTLLLTLMKQTSLHPDFPCKVSLKDRKYS